MMINGIIIAILAIIVVILAYLLYKEKKVRLTSTEELVKSQKRPIIIGKIDVYKEEELEILLSNPEIIDLLLKIFEHKIFIKTDTIRSLNQTELKVGHLNCLHEIHLLFYQMKQKLVKKEEKKNTNLI